MTTTTTATTAADPHAMIWAENARIYDLRRAMYAWRADRVGGRTRLVKNIAREYCASDREITRAFLRISGGFRPDPLSGPRPARLSGPRRLRRRLARRARQGAARAQGHG